MSRRSGALFIALALTWLPAQAAPPSGGWTLVWNDEFDGSGIDSAKWSWGALPWGGQHHNDQYSSYITPEDSYLENGALVLRCRKGSFGGYPWSEGFVHSNGKFRYTFGYVEVRVRYPAGKGLWPAFWTLSDGWPPEFDIAEYFGSDNRMHMGLAYGTCCPVNWNSSNFYDDAASDHTYGLDWRPKYAAWYRDGAVKKTISQADYVPTVGMYFLLNSGMRWDYDNNTPNPNYSRFDYIRLYHRRQYLVNRGFEDGVAAWSTRNGAAASTERAHWGSRALRIAGAGNGAGEQMFYGLLPNTTYYFNGYACTSNGGPAIRLGVKNFGNPEVNVPVTTPDWTHVNFPFTTGTTNTTALAYAWVSAASAIPAYADDLWARQAATVNNWSCETGDFDAFWDSPYGSVTVVRNNARSGQCALRLAASSSASGVEQVLHGLTPSATYQVSAWVRSSGAAAQLGVKNYGGTQLIQTVSGTAYTRGSVSFTTGAGHSNATLLVWAPSAGSDVYVDDFFLAEPLSAPWSPVDIGSGVPVGDSGRRGSNWVVRGSGVWNGGADSGHGVFQEVSDPQAQLVARVRSLENALPNGKAGISFRETTAANARHVSISWLANTGPGRTPVVEALHRSSTGGGTGWRWHPEVPAAPWLRLVRNTNEFTAWCSADGVNWTPVFTNTTPMVASILAGPVVVANTSSDLSEAVFDNVAVLPSDSDGDAIPDRWELARFGSLAIADSASDFDNDGFTDYQEWLSGLDPRATDYLQIRCIRPPAADLLQIEFHGMPDVEYPVEAAGVVVNASWTVVPGVLRSTDPGDLHGGLVLHRYHVPRAGADTQYFRIRLK